MNESTGNDLRFGHCELLSLLSAGLVRTVLIGSLTTRGAVGSMSDSRARGSRPGPAIHFRFSFSNFKKDSFQLMAKVCARSTG